MNSNSNTVERFVDANEAASFLSVTRRRLLSLARAGRIPGHPIGDGLRHTWLFRLSEIATAVKRRNSVDLSDAKG